MFNDGTAMCGEKVVFAKLTKAQVIEIRAIDGKTQAEIAAIYGVVQSAISRIKSGKRWGWISGQQ